MRKAKVLFEYEPQEEDELMLKVGDIITEVTDADVGWCQGLLYGKRGMFPDNFVEMLKEEDEKKAPAPPAANKKPSKKKVLRRMKVNFPYNAENEDELSLEVGDIIEITKDVEEGWAEGINNRGKKGVFPTNFGDVIEASSDSAEELNDADAREEDADNKQNDEMATSSQKKVKGIGFGNIFGEGPIKLRQRSIGEGDKKKSFSTPPAKTPTKEKETHKDTTPSKPKKSLNYCKVMFDYARDNDDELELKKGDIIVILNKNPGDDGWWEGEKEENGKRIKGVFPDNFVAELTPEETKEHERQQQAKSEPEAVKETKSGRPQNKDLKKGSPLAPPQASKPPMTSDTAASNSIDTHFTEPSTTEHTLAHMKRPAGPKNRRKPGAAERREKAAAAVEDQDGAEEVMEEEAPKAEKPPEPAPKKESVKRGVAVLPGLGGPGGEAASGETPSWLQNLKSRQSVRKPPPTQPKETAAAEQPAWLANLKKRQSSEFPEKNAPTAPAKDKVTPQPKPGPDKPKPPIEKPANGPAPHVPPSKPAVPKPVQKPPAQTPAAEKPLAAWQIERQQKARKPKTSDSQDEKAPEPPGGDQVAATSNEATPQPAWKNSLNKKPTPAVKTPTETHPPGPVKKPEKPPVGAPITTPAGTQRAKPPPPKGKPAPAAKPASSTMVEELKNEVKGLREEMMKMRDEMKKEIMRLNGELENEKNHRVTLEEEVRKLRQEVSS